MNSTTLRVIVLRVIVGFVLACVLGPAVQAQQPVYDVVIRGGRLLDGSGNPWVYADVAIADGRIAAVGDLAGAVTDTVIDARGLYVAPGFIDAHSHAGPALTRPDLSAAEPLLAQGTTTVVVNPDGGGPSDLAMQRQALSEDGLGVNVGQLVPHGGVRRAVMGMDDRAPTDDELAAMRALVREGMEAGAFGLSSGLFYAPGSFAETDEVVALAEEAAAFGGVYTSHIRDESDYSVGVLAAVEEVITVARAAGLPGIVTHIKALGPNVWGFSTPIIQRIERARAEGVEVYADQYPYPASATGLTAALIPRWAEAGGDSALVARLRDPVMRDSIRAAMAENMARRGGAHRLQFRFVESDRSLEGRTLAAVAAERGQDPLDTAIDLTLAGGAGVVSFNMHEDDLHAFMRQPWTMTASDGGLVPMGSGVPHPRNYGTFPRKLRRYAVDEGIVDLAVAVRSMTHLPAAVFGMADRGLIRPGAVADVVVFDLDRLHDPATFTDPHRLAEGMVHVLVGGRFAMRDGVFTGTRAGRVLHRHNAASVE